MIRVIAFKVRKDEEAIFDKYADIHGFELVKRKEDLNHESVNECKGFDAVIIQASCIVDESVVKQLKESSCKVLVTRAIGYNNIDIKACRKHQLAVANVTYSSASVAEFTVMLILMSLRKMKKTATNLLNNQPSFVNLKGRELKDLCVGIIGYGSMGKAVVDILKGFNCEVIVYNRSEINDVNIKQVSLSQLYERADIVSLHIPLNEKTNHFISEDEFAQMKDGVVLINTARGGLVKTEALVKNLNNGKLSACGLDVFEDELQTFRDFKANKNNYFSQLQAMDNVILSPHMAFFTEGVTDDCIRIAFENINQFSKGLVPDFSLL